MKPLLCSALLLLTFSLKAQAPVPLAHGNVPGEPHHHLKIENEYVRAYYVEVPPHEDTLLHQHDHDYLFVTLGATEVINAVLGKPEVKLALKDGEVRFTRGGFAHVARNLGDKPFRNVTIELLKPQSEPKNICAQVAPGAAQAPCGKLQTEKRNGVASVPEFQTDETTVYLVQLDPEAGQTTITPGPGTLFIMLSGTGIQTETKGNPIHRLAVGDVMWLLAGSNTTFSNPAHKSWSYLTLGFKGSEALHKY
jgi:quercetin dioxygenase-like cupin family protein